MAKISQTKLDRILPASLRRGYSKVLDIAFVFYACIESDIKTTLLPNTAFGVVAAGDYRFAGMLARLSWVSLHLLQFCLANQIHDPDEDRKNKPSRPIPAGKISITNARRLRWALLPACLVVSYLCGVLEPSLVLTLCTLAYNEGDMGANWLTRNALNGVGYGCFCIGAAHVGRNGLAPAMSASPAVRIAAVNALVIFTTIQAQDFKDVEGDATIGRRTLPIVYPAASRALTAAAVPAWSLLVAYLWDVRVELIVALVTLGFATGVWFLRGRNRKSDAQAYVLYNVWLCVLHVAPFV